MGSLARSTTAAMAAASALAVGACSLEGLGEEYEAPSIGAPSLEREAEEGEIAGLFAVDYDSAASGGRYVSVPLGASCSDDLLNGVRFEFDLEVAGNYRIRTRVIAPDIHSDSFFVTVDGEPAAGYEYHLSDNFTGFFDDFVRDVVLEGGNGVVVLPLERGAHAVEFFCREAGAGLDRVALERVR
jgi:hypothetical protein